MKKTEFKDIVVDTRVYRRVMMYVGECIKGGGFVDYDHRQQIDIDRFGSINTKDTVSVTLHWQ